MSPKGDKLHQNQADFGARFAQEASSYLKKNPQSEVIEKVIEAKNRCHSFITDAVEQLEARLPPSRNTLKNLSNLHPSVVLNQVARPVLWTCPSLSF